MKKLIALLALPCALALAACGSAEHHSKLREDTESLAAANRSMAITEGIDDVGFGQYAKAKRDFEKGCPDHDQPWELVGKAEQLNSEENSMSFGEYKEAAGSLC